MHAPCSSKCPSSNVVLDLSLVPTADLPLQTTLIFQTCPAPVAVSYLQTLCCAEGFIVQRDVLRTLYEAAPDLRRVMQQLQFWRGQVRFCADKHSIDIAIQDSTQIPGHEVRFADLMSYNDSFVESNINGTLKVGLVLSRDLFHDGYRPHYRVTLNLQLTTSWDTQFCMIR